MFGRIKGFFERLFRSEPELEKVELPLDELDSWLDKRSEAIFASAKDKLGSINRRIREEVASCREKLGILEKAELHNPNIPEKEKNFMQGSRTNYLKQVSIFLGRLVLPDDVSAAEDFIQKFGADAEGLARSTSRSYQVLQHFFADESRQVSAAIARIVRLVGELKDALAESSINEVSEVKSLIASLNNKVARKAEIEAELKLLNGRYDDSGRVFRNLRIELEKFLASDSYKEYEALKSRKSTLAEGIKSLSSALVHDFAVLEKALKKFSRVSYDKEELVNSYLADPIAALVNDFELRIVDVLKEVESHIVKDSLDMKDSKREKTIETIRKLTRDYFGKFLADYNRLIKERNDIVAAIEESGIRERHQKLSDESALREKELLGMERNIESLSGELSKMDIDRVERELKERVRKLLKVSLSIA